jgi:hypothetical protein
MLQVFFFKFNTPQVRFTLTHHKVVEFMKIVYDEEKLKDIPSKLPKVRESQNV